MKKKINLIIQKKVPTLNLLKEWVKWLNNSKVSKFSSRGSKKHSIKSQKKFITKKIKDKTCKLFLIKFNSIYVGVIELFNIDLKNKNCEIRYLIGNPNFWGEGIATKSIELATKFGFKKLKLKTIFADTHQDNLASQKVLTKNKYSYQGKIKKFFNSGTKSKDKFFFSLHRN
tara:strand:+ start:195 stop:710 length:516 start_codon:yes stop_codon:yes gene_type:complete